MTDPPQPHGPATPAPAKAPAAHWTARVVPLAVLAVGLVFGVRQLSLARGMLGSVGDANAAPGARTITRPLLIYQMTSETPHRHDCLSVATEDGAAMAERAGYALARVAGWVYAEPGEGRVPLELFHNPTSGDYLTTVSAAGKATASSNGYTFVRVEGYALPYDENFAPAGAVPLNLYYHPKIFDHCTMASTSGESDAKGAGYLFVRTEGYLPSRPVP